MHPREVQETYDQLAPSFDRRVGPLDRLLLTPHRRRLLALAKGRVLEVASGTGRNLSYYPAGCRVTATDLSRGMLDQALRRRDRRWVDLAQADALALPFTSGSFDTVVITLALCTITDPVAALRELSRVCIAGGTILLLEHVRSPIRPLGWLQDRLTPGQVRHMGCHLNRETFQAVRDAELRVRWTRTHWWGTLLLVVAAPALDEAR